MQAVAHAGDEANEGDIAAELGVGAVASDMEVDGLKDVAEAQILSPDNLVGRFGPLITCLCHNRCVCVSPAGLAMGGAQAGKAGFVQDCACMPVCLCCVCLKDNA